jgi:hypothetical protein
VLVMKSGSVAQAVPTKKINFTGWGPMGGETCEQNLKWDSNEIESVGNFEEKFEKILQKSWEIFMEFLEKFL